jgi:hypothetical protein
MATPGDENPPIPGPSTPSDDEAILFSLDEQKSSSAPKNLPKAPTPRQTKPSPPPQPARPTYVAPVTPTYQPTYTPQPTPTPAQPQKKPGCGCALKWFFYVWLGAGIISALSENGVLKEWNEKISHWLEGISNEPPNPESGFAALKQRFPMMPLSHEFLKFDLVEGDTTIAVEDSQLPADSIIVMDITVLKRKRYFLPYGTLKYLGNKKTKKIKKDTYLELTNELAEQLDEEFDVDARIQVQERRSNAPFKVKMKNIHYFEELGIVCMYNRLDHFEANKLDTIYLPQVFYFRLFAREDVSEMEVSDCNVQSLQ